MKPLILLLFTGLLAGSLYSVGKLTDPDQVAPLTLLLWQVTGGGLVLWLVLLLRRQRLALSRQYRRYYLIGGLLGVSIPYALAYLIVNRVSVGLVGLYTALSPLLTYAIARLLGYESGSWRRWSGLALGLAGVLLIMLPRGSGPVTDWRYLLLGLGIPLSLALSNIYRSRAWPTGCQPLPLAAGMLSVQGLWLIPLTLLLGQFQLPSLDPQQAASIGIPLALIAGISYLCTFALLRLSGPVYLSQLGYVITSVTVGIGILFFNEQYSLADWLAIGLIFIGILLTRERPQAAARKQPAAHFSIIHQPVGNPQINLNRRVQEHA